MKLLTLFYNLLYYFFKENWKIIMIWMLSASAMYNYITREERYTRCYELGYSDGASDITEVILSRLDSNETNLHIEDLFEESKKNFLEKVQ